MPIKKPAPPTDDLLRFGRTESVSAEAILRLPENREIFAQQGPRVLHAQDEPSISEHAPKALRVRPDNTYCVLHNPPHKRTLHLVLRDQAGAPRQVDYALSEFVYDGLMPRRDWSFSDELYGFAHEGVVHEELPAAIVQLKLTLADAPNDPLEVQLGRLDPLSTNRGLKARLASLGLLIEDVASAEAGADLSVAVRLFQLRESLPVTGLADSETRARLKAVCGG